MKMRHDYTRLLAKNEDAFKKAAQDVEDEARRNAERNSRTGRFAASLTHTVGRDGEVMVARVGSPLVSARVKEKGGFMQATRAATLTLPAGDGTARRPESVRVRATPAVTPAGRRFPEFMTRRMREAAG